MARPQSEEVTRALKLIAKGKTTPYAAAKKEGIALSTIYRALKRIREQEQKS
jgi:transposase